MEFHVYDTRLVRKYARLLELERMNNLKDLVLEKRSLLLDTIRQMERDVSEVFEREGHDYWWRIYGLAEDLLVEEHRARVRAAEARRKREEQRKREREEAHCLLEQIAA